MRNRKTIYFRNLIRDLFRKKISVVCCVLVFAALFAAIGQKKAKPEEVSLTEEQLAEIEEYNKAIAGYDKAISDLEESLAQATKQVEEVQDYVDNSIYMKMDAQNIQISSVQYAIQTNSNAGAILAAITSYINDGGLKEPLPEEFGELEQKYWRDIISCTTSSNVLTVLVMHYDAELSDRILEVIKMRLEDRVPVIVRTQGEFTLEPLGTAHYVKSDIAVANAQNNNLNNLKNYLSNRADLNNKLVSQQNSKKSYIEKNEPEILEAEPSNIDEKTVMIKFICVGIVFGFALPCVFFMLRYILSDRIRSRESLYDMNLNILGSYNGVRYQPSIDRSGMDIELLAKQQNLSSIYFNVLCDDKMSIKAVSEYQKCLSGMGFKVCEGSHIDENAEELKKMIECGASLLFVQTGKNTYTQLRQQIDLCERFKVNILGCIIIE